jgi:hypothetical protein
VPEIAVPLAKNVTVPEGATPMLSELTVAVSVVLCPAVTDRGLAATEITVEAFATVNATAEDVLAE